MTQELPHTHSWAPSVVCCPRPTSLSALLNASLPSAPYLLEGTLGLQEGNDDEEWDADHGGESQEPANGVSPWRVHIDVVVFERCVLAQGEEESGLERVGQKAGWSDTDEIEAMKFSPLYLNTQ